MITQPSTASVVMLLDPPLPCVTCGAPAGWFAAGVSGCPSHCGAADTTDVLAAREALVRYRAELPSLARRRAGYARAHPPSSGQGWSSGRVETPAAPDPAGTSWAPLIDLIVGAGRRTA